jgi:hypothetical protein
MIVDDRMIDSMAGYNLANMACCALAREARGVYPDNQDIVVILVFQVLKIIKGGNALERAIGGEIKQYHPALLCIKVDRVFCVEPFKRIRKVWRLDLFTGHRVHLGCGIA